MLAALLPSPGRPDRMALGKIRVEEPGAGEVRILVRACGLNPVDAKLALAGVPGWSWPHVAGLDVVGVIDAVGSDVARDLLQRRVAVHHDLRRQGGLAEAVVVTAAAVAAVPDDLDDGVAAALPCPGLTAHQAVRRTGIGPRDKVLVVGAGGGVGTYAVQLAARAGAEVVAVCGSTDAERIARLGASATIDHHAADVLQRGRQLGPFDVVLDLVGSPATAATMRLLSYGGRFASVARPDLDQIPPFTVAPTVVELALGAAYSNGSLRDLRALAADLSALLHAGLQPPPLRQSDLAGAGAALQAILDGTSRGKTVVPITG